MKNQSILIAVVVIVAVMGVAAYSLSQKTPSQPDLVQQTTPESTMDSGDSRYVEYSSTILAQTATNKRVLFFYANWCPTCRPADASFQQNESKIPQDVTLIQVNYNDTDTDAEEKALAQKYGVTYQHTFVQIDAQGNEVTKWNGGQIDQLLTSIK